MEFSKVLNFSRFLNESESNSIKVIVLTGNTKGSKTSKSFVKECEKRGVECFTVDVNDAVLEKVYNGHIIKTTGQNIMIDPGNTVIVPRRGVLENSHTKSVLKELEESRYFTLNTLESMEICENKFITSQFLEDNDLPVPKYSLVPNENSLDKALETIGGKFPVVMKLLSGTQGIGVSIVDSYASLKSVYQTIRKLDQTSEILIQEKIDSQFDLRIQVIIKKFDPLNQSSDNCQILGSMKREAVSRDFRTNYSLGGKVSSYEIGEDLKQLACSAANAVGCHWCGVDIMIDSKTKKPYILEVNSSPGTEGISQAIGKPIVNDVLNYILDTKNWIPTTMEIGYLETLKVPGLGTVVAKFDTGNGAKSCTIHADKIEEKDGKLFWSVGKKNFVNDIIGTSQAEVGQKVEIRPIIMMDLEFNGVVIEAVKVSPTNRSEKSTPFLVNRNLMRRLGMIVNPHKAFVVTEEPGDKYRVGASKGVAHAGINFEK